MNNNIVFVGFSFKSKTTLLLSLFIPFASSLPRGGDLVLNTDKNGNEIPSENYQRYRHSTTALTANNNNLRHRKLMMKDDNEYPWQEFGNDIVIVDNALSDYGPPGVGGFDDHPLEYFNYCVPFEDVSYKTEDNYIIGADELLSKNECCLTNTCDTKCCRDATVLVHDEDDDLPYIPCICNMYTLTPSIHELTLSNNNIPLLQGQGQGPNNEIVQIGAGQDRVFIPTPTLSPTKTSIPTTTIIPTISSSPSLSSQQKQGEVQQPSNIDDVPIDRIGPLTPPTPLTTTQPAPELLSSPCADGSPYQSLIPNAEPCAISSDCSVEGHCCTSFCICALVNPPATCLP